MRCSKRWVLPDHASICHSAFRFRSVVEGINHVSTMVERFEERSGCAVSCMLEGDLMVGWCSTTDSSDGAAAFGRIAWMRLPYWKATVYTWCMAEWQLDTVTLVDGFRGIA